MALKNHLCSNGHVFEGLTQFSNPCPQCGEEGTAQFTPAVLSFDCGKNVHLLDKAEIQMALRNKKSIEKRASEVHSGAVTLRPGKNEPSEFKPRFEKTLH